MHCTRRGKCCGLQPQIIADSVIVGAKSSSQEKFQISDSADRLNGLGLGEVRDINAYATGLVWPFETIGRKALEENCLFSGAMGLTSSA